MVSLGGSLLGVSLLTVGSEILDGRVIDTNSQFLCQLLHEQGFEIRAKLSCDDEIEEIVAALSFLSARSQTIIITGGLGPTSDDLTREAISSFVGEELILDERILTDLKAWYQRRGRVFCEANIKQAMRPAGASIIPNPVGTAPGIWLEQSGSQRIIALPGVPRELKEMMVESVLPKLVEAGGRELQPYHTSLFRLIGLPESEIGARVSTLDIPESIKVSYRASIPEVHVKLSSRIALGDWPAQVRNALGEEFIFSTRQDLDLSEVVVDLLRDRQLTLATCESCTGGEIGRLITDIPGASEVYVGGFVCYANEFKEYIVGVPGAILGQHGAVSGECARELAERTRQVTQSSISISASGIAGPEGGTPKKPVGTFWLGLSKEGKSVSYRFFFPSSRGLIRKWAAFKALDLVRRELLNLPPPRDALSDDVHLADAP